MERLAELHERLNVIDKNLLGKNMLGRDIDELLRKRAILTMLIKNQERYARR